MYYNRLFSAYRRYKDGFLPEEGSIADQPNLLVEAFDEIGTLVGILDQEDLDKGKNKGSGGNGGTAPQGDF